MHVYADGEAFEVEFTTLEGRTAAVATVEAAQVRPVSSRETTHASERAAVYRDRPPVGGLITPSSPRDDRDRRAALT